jgi:hypothetical protein
MLDQENAKRFFDYKNGVLYWKEKPHKFAHIKVGDKAGTVKGTGYMQTVINRKIYLNHRLIYLYHHGYIPKIIDHIDGDKKNNKIENLREATRCQNGYNSKRTVKNFSGSRGVVWSKKAKKWQVQIKYDGKHRYIGLFEDLELADLVSKEARDKYHGQFASYR